MGPASAPEPNGVTGAPAPGFAEVYRDYFRFVWRNVRRLGIAEHAAEDVVQEVFVIIHRKLPSFEGRGTVRSWVYGILRRVVSDHRRSRAGHDDQRPDRGAELEQLASRQAAPDARLEHAQDVALLFQLLDTLGDQKREVLILAELEELSAPEIAAALELPLNTVYSRLRLARVDFDAALARHRAREGWRKHG